MPLFRQNPPAVPQPDPAAALIGKRAPGFTMPDQNDKSVKLSDQKGKWVVLAFYPADMTTGCTFQNRSYTAHKDEFGGLNAVVYTVSVQDTASKRAFCDKEGLTHTLLSDIGAKVAREYAVLMPNRPLARRVTFYINPDGQIALVDGSIKVQSAAEDSLALLAKLGAGLKKS